MKRLSWRWIKEGFWLWLFLLALLIRSVSSQEQIEQYYSRGLFLYIRQGLDAITGFLPFALLYPLLGFLLLVLVIKQILIWRKKKPFLKRLLRSGWSIINGLLALAFTFTLMWGFNYGRLPLESQLDLQVSPIELDVLICKFEELSLALEDYRAAIPGADTTAMGAEFLPDFVEQRCRRGLESLIGSWDYPTVGSMRARLVLPKGILLRFNTSGVYLPWTGEGHVDAGLHPVQQPFVMIHEMAHGYGFTDEGTCNFLAVLGGLECKAPFIRYSVLLGYWRYMASNIRPYDRDAFSEQYKQLSTGIRADLKAIYEYQDAYPELFPSLRYYAYDTYLRAQGIQEGILSYDRVIGLMDALEIKEERRRF